MAYENHSGDFDTFDKWLASCPPTTPPARLRDRCAATILRKTDSIEPVRSRRHLALAPKLIAAVSSAIAAAIVITLISGSREQSVFAQALEQSAKAPAMHIVETYVDPVTSPGLLVTSEWWIVPGAGFRRISKKNGVVEFVVVVHNGQSTEWIPERNIVEIRPSHEAVGDVPYFTDAALALRRLETMAKDQTVPIRTEEAQKDGKAIRRIQITNLTEGRQADSALMLTLVVDIDTATNRVVKKWSHEWAVGQDRSNYAAQDATLVMDVDYPALRQLPESLFKLEYPASAKVARQKQ